ncbi:putative short-chain dehydrogenases/reductase [Rhizodiscina lignyota]|uniref:Short-chain dehydrogenases/reductase n=1 Tax=Rhizodiscina lignyota TaxID=1504668 RepID=A0A9P4M318_9PEZI|nr:putative short-chain dehydrogenases/reductase [Rhizodiscina lignyota]
MGYPDLQGKVALVTGIGQMGDTGIGQQDPNIWGNGAAIAKKLYDYGAKVFGCDLVLSSAEETQGLIKSASPSSNTPGSIDVIQADVTSASSVKAMINACIQKHGRIDILVNNVGRPAPGGAGDMDEATWDAQINVNLKSVFLCSKFALPHLESVGGVVVNLGSVAGVGWTGKAQIGYATTKGAVIQYTRVAAVEYAKRGVRFNCVSPGLVHTPLVTFIAQKYPPYDYDATIKKRNNQVPMGKMGRAWDVAEGVCWLSSEKSGFVTGHNLLVDGGQVASLL